MSPSPGRGMIAGCHIGSPLIAACVLRPVDRGRDPGRPPVPRIGRLRSTLRSLIRSPSRSPSPATPAKSTRGKPLAATMTGPTDHTGRSPRSMMDACDRPPGSALSTDECEPAGPSSLSAPRTRHRAGRNGLGGALEPSAPSRPPHRSAPAHRRWPAADRSPLRLDAYRGLRPAYVSPRAACRGHPRRRIHGDGRLLARDPCHGVNHHWSIGRRKSSGARSSWRRRRRCLSEP